ncbi:hypothetical protein IWQ62_000493 [Dispira parvispora]|uniref:Zn(2)-C6 fungal-type domain-containing protein n=1 Tax=Dispira parvispora TaxID=1520584 RepID=A0A9W8AUP7_9FUNG|nr:hypothetical protein IWQ62_000493 [Dispira parvispora]
MFASARTTSTASLDHSIAPQELAIVPELTSASSIVDYSHLLHSEEVTESLPQLFAAAAGRQCEPCRLNHVPCDGIAPVCSRCVHSGSACSYKKSMARGKRPRGSLKRISRHAPTPGSDENKADMLNKFDQSVRTIETLESKIKSLESKIELLSRQASSISLDTILPSTTSSSLLCSGTTPTSSTPPAPSKTSSGSGAGELVATVAEPNWVVLPDTNPPVPLDFTRLNDYVMHQMLGERCFRLVHLFDVIVHYYMVQELKKGPLSRPSVFLCALFATLANRSIGKSDPSDLSEPSGDVFFRYAKSKVPSALEENNVVNVATMAMLARYEMSMGRNQNSWMYLGLGLRLAQRMKLNQPDSIQPVAGQSQETWLAQETSRRIWWMTYMLDVTFGLMSGRSPSVFLDDCQLDFPSSDMEYVCALHKLYKIPSDVIADHVQLCHPSNSRSEPSLQYYDVTLCNIAAVVGRLLNRQKNGLLVSANEHEEIHQALVTWQCQLPTYLQCNQVMWQSEKDQFPLAATCKIQLHINYYALIVTLNWSRIIAEAQVMVPSAELPTPFPQTPDGQFAKQQCYLAACELMVIFQALRTVNPDHFPTLMTYSIFQTGLVFALSAQDPCVLVAPQHSQACEFCLQLLDGMGIHRPLGRICATLLRQVAADPMVLQTVFVQTQSPHSVGDVNTTAPSTIPLDSSPEALLTSTAGVYCDYGLKGVSPQHLPLELLALNLLNNTYSSNFSADLTK